MIKQSIDLPHHVGTGSSLLPRIEGKRHSKGLGNAALESNVCCDLTVFDECHVLQQKPYQPLSLAVGCFGIPPQLWKVMCQDRDTRTLLFADLSPIVFALLLILLLGGMQCPQFVVPVGLSRESATSRFAGST